MWISLWDLLQTCMLILTGEVTSLENSRGLSSAWKEVNLKVQVFPDATSRGQQRPINALHVAVCSGRDYRSPSLSG